MCWYREWIPLLAFAPKPVPWLWHRTINPWSAQMTKYEIYLRVRIFFNGRLASGGNQMTIGISTNMPSLPTAVLLLCAYLSLAVLLVYLARPTEQPSGVRGLLQEEQAQERLHQTGTSDAL